MVARPARLLRFAFESSCKDRLRVAHSYQKEQASVTFSLIQSFSGPESPPERDENRKTDRNAVSISSHA